MYKNGRRKGYKQNIYNRSPDGTKIISIRKPHDPINTNTPTCRRMNFLRQWFDNLKRTMGCSICNENVPECIIFHHIDTMNKKFCCSFSFNAAGRQSNWDVLKELSKCAPLCQNCHTKVHAAVKEICQQAKFI